MYLLDTNHCSLAIISNPNILTRLSESSDIPIATNAIVRGELINMAAQSQQKQNNLTLIQNFLNSITLHPIDAATADIYGQLKADLFDKFAPKDKSQRRRFTLQNIGFGENDLWIASTALQYQLTLVTADRDFLRIQEACNLTLDNWT